MTDPDTRPIEINPDPTAAQLAILLRYAITSLGGYAAGKGWVDGDLVQIIASLSMMAAPMLYAAWRSHQEKAALVTIATAAPNSVAVLKVRADKGPPA